MVAWALSIAGSDPSGGAGIQADLKAFHARGTWGCAVPTLLTVQNPSGVRDVHPVAPELVEAQAEAVLEEILPGAVKTGTLHNAAMVRAVSRVLATRPQVPYVLDPIILSGTGRRMLDDHGVWAMTELLLPRCTLITPNAQEASVLTRRPVRDESEAREAALALQALGARAVLVKGGHLGDADAVDVLFDGAKFETFTHPRLDVARVHGSGCLLSAVITAELAKGATLAAAVRAAKRLLARALERGHRLASGVLLPDPHALAD
ncbi:MAG: bifunctional hydroxymethylpyrimidine kinase/phosphomethylpyrimidine kinase [Deltaproteobacteria bacterium]|nr:bifunctional hydroxymethylpyrimidine kinase/phosphomethylpyrimidine kinase [Deltaproteobacteria bacterium]